MNDKHMAELEGMGNEAKAGAILAKYDAEGNLIVDETEEVPFDQAVQTEELVN